MVAKWSIEQAGKNQLASPEQANRLGYSESGSIEQDPLPEIQSLTVQGLHTVPNQLNALYGRFQNVLV